MLGWWPNCNHSLSPPWLVALVLKSILLKTNTFRQSNYNMICNIWTSWPKSTLNPNLTLFRQKGDLMHYITCRFQSSYTIKTVRRQQGLPAGHTAPLWWYEYHWRCQKPLWAFLVQGLLGHYEASLAHLSPCSQSSLLSSAWGASASSMACVTLPWRVSKCAFHSRSPGTVVRARHWATLGAPFS